MSDFKENASKSISTGAPSRPCWGAYSAHSNPPAEFKEAYL